MKTFEDLVQDGLSLPFSGWDFSIIRDRWKTTEPTWDYPALARHHMQGISSMLDQDTGGGELLATFSPFPPHTWATERYPPNIPIAKNRLEPLGAQVISDYTISSIPLPSSSIDLVLNRHGSYSEPELFRLLKPGGIFLTQQVGERNNILLNELLQEKADIMYSDRSIDSITRRFQDAGFIVLIAKEEFPLAEFIDIGAVVFYLRIISWQIRNFLVEKYRDKLYKIHEDILAYGPLQVHEHRILIKARKPE